MQVTLCLAAFVAGIMVLFSTAICLLLDMPTQTKTYAVVNSTFAARVDTDGGYASRPEMTITPLQTSVIPAAAPSVSD